MNKSEKRMIGEGESLRRLFVRYKVSSQKVPSVVLEVSISIITVISFILSSYPFSTL